MSIDKLIDWIIFPLLKYPIFLYLVLCPPQANVCLFLVCYSLLLIFCNNLNHWYKCKGNEDWQPLNEVEGATVLITGGSDGLGRSIVLEILARYPRVKVLNIDLQKSPQSNPRLVDIECNVGDIEALDHCLDRIKACYGDQLSLIVNNAGIRAPYQDMDQQQKDTIQNIFGVNTFGPIMIMQKLIPSNRQCYVINVASTLGVLAPARLSTYAASKAALIAFHNSYSSELSTNGMTKIRTLLVLAGQLNTNMFRGFEPPRQFFAPMVNKKTLANKIIDYSARGERGELCVPFYSNFAHLLMALPILPRALVRKLSKMDSCLPQE
ncbi:TDA5 (YLR426W) [Zygosaccharomyces parabailii]|uniref:ZYBA0S11-02916g1_1 n=1 Tax=Zygosaccharomyces bailii (strain CLIB 213 / ATCC 58445 / CBS 680 / BCRC 21525 / NBRC 1098 / NCYC 1416 / NRRL Y-2227) TaxID=1333698 RepID=A0A8J2TAC8_ZYGB2|nr:TDA5 (YLR426W) [Zygosaccharomyces parabailii]CDF91441.1 ZYBA0S11-02916g1_1 [Zygosaccharomyces bailii CLIB 213]CDH17132.1 related to Putative 3-oxoacyl-[acyl-carrier-protein] reductase [Zygosaccharomyces bailii ISA1307]